MNRHNSVSAGIRIFNIALGLGLVAAAGFAVWSVFIEPESALTQDVSVQTKPDISAAVHEKEQGGLSFLMSSSFGLNPDDSRDSGSDAGRLRLCGLAKGKNRSWAVLEDRQSRTQIIASVGDRVFGCELKSVEENKVVLLKDGRETELVIRVSARKATESKPALNVQASNESAKIVKKSQNTWNVKRAEIDLAFSDLAALRKTARIIPFYRSGTAAGFLVFDIKAKSPLLEIGLKNGDIVTHINGKLLTSEIGPAELFSMLSSRDNVNLLVNRNSSTINLCYRIR